MPIEVKMAKLSPTMESGQLVRWLVKVGDAVKEGDSLAEIQTDKAVMPMESFDDGTVAHLDVAEGDTIALGQRVLILAKKGEDPKAVAASAGGGGAAKTAPAASDSAQAVAATERETTNTPHPAAVNNGQAAPESTSAPVPAGASAETVPASGRVKSSPLARKVAAEAGVDIRQVPPSGPGGRIIRNDVETFLTQGPRPAAQPAAPVAKAPAKPIAAPGAVERIVLSPMRKTIANRMTEVQRNVPDIHLTVDIKLDAVVALRESLNKQLAAEKIKLSVGDFVTKAVAVALRRHPAMNATFEGDAIHQHGDVNIGIAVALDGGLIVPVLHRADSLGLKQIRQGTEALAAAARSNKLTGEQLTGGTFTISNLGMYGIRQFDAILNIPQVGILAVGSAEKRAVVIDDALGIATMMTVTLTADHRAIDGAGAAEFLRTFRGLLEEPATMLL